MSVSTSISDRRILEVYSHLVCSPTNIICFPVNNRLPTYGDSLGNKTHIILRLEKTRYIKLMHPNLRRRPTRTLQRIQRPALPAIPPRILLPRHVPVDLNHRVQNVLHVLELRERGEPDPEVGVGVAREHYARAGAVELVAGVADAPDAGDVGCGGAAAEDGEGEVLPEAGAELECYLGWVR